MGFFQNEMYVVCTNNRIVRVDLRTGKELGSYSSFAGGVGLGTPGRLFFHNDTFYLAGRNANAPRLIQGKLCLLKYPSWTKKMNNYDSLQIMQVCTLLYIRMTV